MKKLKLGFCRIKCQLSFHVKLLTNNAKIYRGTQKFTKNVFFRRYGQNDGGSLEYRSFDHDTLFETLLNHEFSSKHIHDFISLKFMKFKQRAMIKKSIFQRTPIILSISSKKHVFGKLLSSKVNFCIIGQRVLTKIFAWNESSHFISQNPSFNFSIIIFRGSWDISIFRVL